MSNRVRCLRYSSLSNLRLCSSKSFVGAMLKEAKFPSAVFKYAVFPHHLDWKLWLEPSGSCNMKKMNTVEIAVAPPRAAESK